MHKVGQVWLLVNQSQPRKEYNMQFLALLEAVAGIVSPSNITEVVSLVEKLVVLGEQAANAVQSSQKQP